MLIYLPEIPLSDAFTFQFKILNLGIYEEEHVYGQMIVIYCGDIFTSNYENSIDFALYINGGLTVVTSRTNN